MYNSVELDSDHRILTVTFKVSLRTTRHVNLYLNTGNHQQLVLKTKTALHDCRVGIRYISYLPDISLKMLNGCSIFYVFGQVIQ